MGAFHKDACQFSRSIPKSICVELTLAPRHISRPFWSDSTAAVMASVWRDPR